MTHISIRIIRVFALVGILFLASACASHARIKCNAHLEPINPPHAKPLPESPK
jgi:hypothetical protein